RPKLDLRAGGTDSEMKPARKTVRPSFAEPRCSGPAGCSPHLVATLASSSSARKPLRSPSLRRPTAARRHPPAHTGGERRGLLLQFLQGTSQYILPPDSGAALQFLGGVNASEVASLGSASQVSATRCPSYRPVGEIVLHTVRRTELFS